ncbi:phytanoyl-CoA dioxygenase family protein [Siphonobacter aquaeclarae]|uniref:Phytanoyl-CoA dioxygenase (PhyH) n=1 Tax=Siphonobacter aquaeclarae TaxID=563176 RepID=A0A1G9YGV1_9BACT|nr:phytanoyl-CoA dioxygenase family protein [Siphonobacter aquaeclarae]SDN08287.1 Phytanoyl-CoA dioxygenase (PhyH) [Siphonobacter aquaeclarae]
MNLSVQVPWTESPFFESELEAAGLSPEMKAFVRFFSENGYVIIDPGIDEQTLDEAVATLKPRFSERRTNRLQDEWPDVAAVRRIAAAPKVMELLEILYRREPIPFQTLNFSSGSQQRTHSDSIHFHSLPERYLARVWVALEDIHDGNGPLHYYPGSHRLPFYDLASLGLPSARHESIEELISKYYAQYEDFIEQLVVHKHLQKKTLNLRKGQALIWSANLLHGGEKIRDAGSSRYTQVTHYYFENCAYYRPMRTELALERVCIQQVFNIATGREVPSRYLGTAINHTGHSYTIQLPKKLLQRLFPESFRIRVRRLLGK